MKDQDTWAIVAWDGQGNGILFDGDTWTSSCCSDWGCDSHWSSAEVPDSSGVYKWSGKVRFIEPDDFELIGSWTSIPDHHEQLRRQAEQLCERRTIERDEARSALAHQAEDAELGRALRDLVTQLRRLRRYKIPKHVWTPSGVLASLRDEANELGSEVPCTFTAKSEVLDVVSCSLQLMDMHNVEMIEGFTRAAMKLDQRLTHIDEGGTWESAKELENQ